MAEVGGKKNRGRKYVLIGGGALGIFLLTVPVFLFLNGMLSIQAPYLRPAEGYEIPDSILAAYTLSRGDSALVGETTDSVADDLLPPEGGQSESAVPAGTVTEMEVASETASQDEGVVVSEPDTIPARGPEEEEASADTNTYLASVDQQRMTRLVRLYEKMRPKQVSLILATMPEREAAAILTGMSEKQAAKVLAEMEPGKAARMSQMLMRMSGNDA